MANNRVLIAVGDQIFPAHDYQADAYLKYMNNEYSSVPRVTREFTHEENNNATRFWLEKIATVPNHENEFASLLITIRDDGTTAYLSNDEAALREFIRHIHRFRNGGLGGRKSKRSRSRRRHRRTRANKKRRS